MGDLRETVFSGLGGYSNNHVAKPVSIPVDSRSNSLDNEFSPAGKATRARLPTTIYADGGFTAGWNWPIAEDNQ